MTFAQSTVDGRFSSCLISHLTPSMLSYAKAGLWRSSKAQHHVFPSLTILTHIFPPNGVQRRKSAAIAKAHPASSLDFCPQEPPNSFHWLIARNGWAPEANVLARIGAQFSPVSHYTSQMVSENMATLLDVNLMRETCITAFVFEPALALAAGWISGKVGC